MTRIPIAQPWFDEDEERGVLDVLRSGWVAQGPRTAEFEARFAECCGVEHAVAVSSGTTALHLALLVAGIRPGDEVLVPSFTWVATANAVAHCGATPVMCDIDLATYNLDVDDADQRRTARTRAIMPVHQFGLPADMDTVSAVADAHGLRVIGDAACAFGATYHGRPAGSLAPLETFSFHPRKPITTGEGGMITTNDGEAAAALRSLRSHGPAPTPPPPGAAGSLLADIDRLGFNYRMTDIQAAIGLAQVAKAPDLLATRRAQVERYNEALADLPWLRTPHVPDGSEHAYQSYVVLMAGPDGAAPTLADLPALNDRRNRVMSELDQAGITTRQGTHAVHSLSLYGGGAREADEALPNALLAGRLSFSLPLFHRLTPEQQARVVEALASAYAATA